MPNPLINKRVLLSSGKRIGAYTTAFNAVVVSRGGSLTANELSYLTTFENSVGADMAEFDRLWIHGLSNQIAAKTSFVNPSSTAITEVNSPTWTANQGYTGNGSTSYLDTNYNTSTNSVKYTQNSASLIVYSRTNSQGLYVEIGNATATNLNYILCKLNINGTYFAVNCGFANQNGNNTNSLGLFVASRTTSILHSLYQNGSFVNSANQASTSIVNSNLFLLANNNGITSENYSPRQISLSGTASGAINQSNFYNAVQALGTSIGWAV